MNELEAEPTPGKNQELGPEAKETSTVETGIETEQNQMAGAELLEAPSDGSFVHGLHVFVAWVASLLANDK